MSVSVKNNKLDLPILYQNRNTCSGCTACFAICPKDAIRMIEDEEGFDYPIVDPDKCICCYKCLKICPFKE